MIFSAKLAGNASFWPGAPMSPIAADGLNLSLQTLLFRLSSCLRVSRGIFPFCSAEPGGGNPPPG